MLIYLMFFIYIMFATYILLRLMHWLNGLSTMFSGSMVQKIVIGSYILLASTVILGGLLPDCRIQEVFSKIGNYWLGTFLYVLMFLVLADLVMMIMKRIYLKEPGKRSSISWYYAVGVMVGVASLAMSLYGFVHARSLTVTQYEVSVNKEVDTTDHLRIALVADFHLGYNIGCEKIQQMVDAINEMHPDLVVIAGDIFDNNYDALDNEEELIRILSSIDSTYGTYATFGNHDVEETLIGGFSLSSKRYAIRDSRMNEFLKKCNITVLEDDVTTIMNGEIQLVGRLDSEKAGDGTDNRLTMDQIVNGLDQSKPIIVIDHEPNELDEAEACGVDILLSGHTHDGQFFPLTLTQPLVWDNPHGLKTIGEMHSFVTSGVGLYGPNMRVGSDSEVMQIDVDFSY